MKNNSKILNINSDKKLVSSNKKRIIIKEEIVDHMLDIKDDRWWITRKKDKFLYLFIDELPYWLKCKYQKFRYGFSACEAWDFYSFHAEWCLPRLKSLRKNLHGCPDIFVNDEDNKDYEDGHKKWEEILDQIIWSFDNIDNHPDPEYPADYNHKSLKKTYSDGSARYKSLDERHPCYKKIEEHEERVQKGLDLFAKYYFNLWD